MSSSNAGESASTVTANIKAPVKPPAVLAETVCDAVASLTSITVVFSAPIPFSPAQLPPETVAQLQVTDSTGSEKTPAVAAPALALGPSFLTVITKVRFSPSKVGEAAGETDTKRSVFCVIN